jgi:spore coat polysaccharide biosynthesis predicted glycosyltransferase SpsG
MTRREVVFRCDGGRRIGAGHVARSVRIAAAFRAAGWIVRFVGSYDSVALSLIDAAGVDTRPPSGAPLGVEPGEDPVIVDSYELAFEEMEALARVRPVAFIADHDTCPRVSAVVSYHLDSDARVRVPAGTAALLGPAYAPADPRGVAARRERGFGRVLVAMGGGDHGENIIGRILDEVGARSDLDIFVAGVEEVPRPGPRVQAGILRGGLAERIQWADAAVSGSGSTPYDLACAGVPAIAVALADNQVPIARSFADAGIAIGLDATRNEPDLEGALARLCDAPTRRAMASAGPQAVDGYGAFRARDALAAVFAGTPVPPAHAYPPDAAGGIELRAPGGALGSVRLRKGSLEATFTDGVTDVDAGAALGGAAELLLAAYPSLDALEARPGAEQRAFYEAAGFHVEAGRAARRDRRPEEGAIQT